MPTPSNPELEAKIQRLQDCIRLLRGRDIAFASSLCQQYWSRGSLTEKQLPYVDKLIEKATRPASVQAAPAPAAQPIGNLDGILQLFNRAREHLTKVAIVLLTELEGEVSTSKMMRLTPAPATGRNPGSVYITSFDYVSGNKRAYYGLINPQGMFKPGAVASEELVQKIVVVLRALAANPAEVAGVHGRLTGRCCFCRIPLDDERSTAVGYGPICAGHYGLPWGDRPAEFAGRAVS